MFKRRDWVYTHNPDTGDVTSDSDSDVCGVSTSSEGEQDAASQDQDGESSLATDDDANVVPMRMEDLQDMLDLNESEEHDGQVREQETVDAATAIRAGTIQQGHMKSKAHLAAAKRHGVLNDPMEQLESIVAASSQRPEAEESETHRERVERFRQISEGLKQRKQTGMSQQANKARKKRRKCPQDCQDGYMPAEQADATKDASAQDKKGSLHSGKRHERPKRKKPGKRQRMEAKAATAKQNE